MLPLERLDHLQACIRQIVDEQIPGDVIETGVWRGGATISLRGALEAYGDRQRVVWVADSFEGLPKPVTSVRGRRATLRASTYGSPST